MEQLCKEFKNQAEEVKSKVESKKRLLTAKLKVNKCVAQS